MYRFKIFRFRLRHESFHLRLVMFEQHRCRCRTTAILQSTRVDYFLGLLYILFPRECTHNYLPIHPSLLIRRNIVYTRRYIFGTHLWNIYEGEGGGGGGKKER